MASTFAFTRAVAVTKAQILPFQVVKATDDKGVVHEVYWDEKGAMFSYHQLPLTKDYAPQTFTRNVTVEG